jgi:iron complex outermembrane receptor protein
MRPKPEHRSIVKGCSAVAAGMALPCIFVAQIAAAEPAEQSTADASGEILEYVIVTGSQVELPPEFAGGQVARGGRVGLFGNLDLMDTPFNSTNYTADFMRNLQARSVADVVQSDPAVRVARGFGNFQELYVVRGLPVYSDDMSYNGLYGLLPRQYVAAEFLERVEVFRGANSFLNGAAPGGSGLGGSFNLVPKRAPDNALDRITVGWENDSQGYLAADFARRLGQDGDFGVRANGVLRDGEMSVARQDRELQVLSLGMDYRGEQARFSADFGWQDHTLDAPRPSVTPATAIPRPPSASSNFAQDWSFSGEKDFFGVARGEYDIGESGSVWAAAGIRDSEEHNVLANPTADPAGNTSTFRFDNFREDRVTTGELGVRTEFDTGAVGHRVSVQAAYFELDSQNAFALSNFAGFPGSLYTPVQVPPPPANFFTGGILFEPLTTNKSTTTSVAIADTLAFADEKVLVTLGARYQIIEQTTYDFNTGAALSTYDESVVTPAFGIVVKPAEGYSLYANYIEGLLRGDQVPGVVTTPSGPVTPSNAGELLDPFQTEQYEIGAKYDSGRLGATVAIYRITQPSAILDGTVVRDDGETRNQGIELSWYGQVSESVRVLGGITALEATAEKTQFGINQGNDVIGVPDTQANIGVEWDVPGVSGLSLDGRWIYTSSQAANAANTLSIPSWDRLDIGARFALTFGSTEVTVRARIDNVFDENYWASVGGSFSANYLVLGGPRTYVVSASFDF